jgi:hypothetical protein
MNALAHLPLTTVPTPRKPQRPAKDPITREDPAYRDAYELLFEAAHLVTQAGRKLRGVHETDAGFALQALADDIHAHIRRLPAAARHRAYEDLRRPNHGSEGC